MSFITEKKKISLKNWNPHFCDFETIVVESIHYVTCISVVSSNNIQFVDVISDFNQNNIQTLSEELIERFLSYCFKLLQEKTSHKILFYFHNFSRFDSFFIIRYCCKKYEIYKLKVISRKNVIYQLNISNKFSQNQIMILDTYLITNMSLDKFASLYKYKKIEFNHNHSINDYESNQFIENLKKYCLNDAYILMRSFIEFRLDIIKMFNIDIYNVKSLSSLALNIFRTHYYNSKKYPIEHPVSNDAFFRKSYMGGIADVYKPRLLNGYHYDINSLYPYIMKTQYLPIGSGKYTNRITKKELETTFFELFAIRNVIRKFQ